MFKLGIDAKWYFDGPPSGKVVVRNLLNEALNHKDNEIDIYIIVNYKNKKEAENLFCNKAKVISTLPMPNLISNVFLIPFLAYKFKLDAVLFQNFVPFIKSKWKKIAYIHDFLFLDYPEYFNKSELLYYKPMKYLAKRSDVVITISNSEKERILKHNISTVEKTFVVYHGVSNCFQSINKYDQSRVDDVKSKYHLPTEYLLYVGRINIRKNLLNLVRAITYTKKKDLKLVIVGEKDFKNVDLWSTIKSYGLENRIIFTGHVPNNDLYLIYAMASAFCFPSFAEGFGLPPLEAMKCGIPVIVSDRTSLPEICGNAGIYVNPEDCQDIASKIDSLFMDKEFYNLKVKQSTEHVQKFNWSNSVKSLLQIIKSSHGN